MVYPVCIIGLHYFLIVFDCGCAALRVRADAVPKHSARALIGAPPAKNCWNIDLCTLANTNNKNVPRVCRRSGASTSVQCQCNIPPRKAVRKVTWQVVRKVTWQVVRHPWNLCRWGNTTSL